MRALRLHGTDDLRLEEVAKPTPGRLEVIVAVAASGVCGSDLHFLDGSARTAHLPITLGHEIAGEVVAGDAEWPAGSAVAVSAGTHCGECPRCRESRVNLCERAEVMGIDRDGGLADLVAVPKSLLISRPPHLDPAEAATAVDAGATAWHAVTRRADVHAGDTVVIIGVGGLGTYGVQIAARRGATVVAVDTDPGALDRARILGADEVVLAEAGMSIGREAKRLTGGGADIAIEFVGRASTIDAAVKCLRPGGRAVAVGVGVEPLHTLPAVLWSNNEYTLTGSYGSLPGDTEAVLSGLADGTLAAPPLRRIGFAEAPDVIEAMARGEEPNPGRLVVIPD